MSQQYYSRPPQYRSQSQSQLYRRNQRPQYNQGPPPGAASSWYDERPQNMRPIYVDPRGPPPGTFVESDPAYIPVPRLHGREDFVDFGKYAGQTFYEIVNDGNAGYVNWLKKGKFFDGWLLDPSCIAHIEVATKINPRKGQKWVKQIDETSGEHWWECQVGENETLTSPKVKNLQ